MAIKRARHAVYDTRYHLVWAPKYRKWILRGDVRNYVEAVFKDIAAANDFEIEAMEIADVSGCSEMYENGQYRNAVYFRHDICLYMKCNPLKSLEIRIKWKRRWAFNLDSLKKIQHLQTASIGTVSGRP